MISTLDDRSDVFNRKHLATVFPKLFTELVHNSTYSRIIAELCPQGVDVSVKPSISVNKGPYSRKFDNSIDGVASITWTINTLDDIKFRLSLIRDYDSVYNPVGCQIVRCYYDRFFLTLKIIDKLLEDDSVVRLPLIVNSTVVNVYVARTDFDSFIINESLAAFNSDAILIDGRYASYKQSYIAAKTALRRF